MALRKPLEQQNRWIWPFELLERIGEGGMGEVYRARFVKNDRIVAVKLLPAEVTNATVLARFEREMKILRSLRHPNIVLCFGGTCEGDRQFYAMELVEGGTLSDVLRRQGRLSVDRTIEYARQMCAALTFAHERGVIHRDLKPGNFLLTNDGRLKLSDFGLATIAAGRKITADDRTVGTFLYMAPEQITGKPPVSPQTDLYGLGCVLFELLTGSPPFRGETAGEVLHKHLGEPAPRVIDDVMACPPELDRLISRLLEKKPEDRPADAKEVAAALNDCGNSITVIERRPSLLAPTTREPQPPPPVVAKPATGGGARSSRPAPLWVISACALLLAALFAWNRSLARRAAAFERAEAALLAEFQSGSRDKRIAASTALAAFARESPQALEALVAALADLDPQVRYAAAVALGETGSAGHAVRYELVKTQKLDDRQHVRLAAAESIKKIDAAPRPAGRWPWIAAAVVLAALAGAALWFRIQARQEMTRFGLKTPAQSPG